MALALLLASWLRRMGGGADVTSLAWSMRRLSKPTLSLHQIFANLLEMIGATLRDIRISERAYEESGPLYRAELTIEYCGRLTTHLARPSDALNLAHICSASILVKTFFLQ